jgi:hypothetical protein
MGRPRTYNQALADSICTLIIEGKSLRAICKMSSMPSLATVCRWLAENDARTAPFREQYARAKKIQAELLADELIDISDEKVIVGDDKSDNARVQAQRLRVDTRKWVASRLLPKKWGDAAAKETGDTDADSVKELTDTFRERNEILKAGTDGNGNGGQT